MFIPCLVTGQRFLKSYEITVRHPVNPAGFDGEPASFHLEYSEIAVHHEGANYWWIIPGFPGACFPYCCSMVTERRRDGHIHDTALVGWAEEPEFRKSMVRFELVESNDKELKYAREGKDATVAYELEGSREESVYFPKWVEENKAKCFVCGPDNPRQNLNDDARIRDFTGEMIIRDGEIVLTESYDGREPYTITLKEVFDAEVDSSDPRDSGSDAKGTRRRRRDSSDGDPQAAAEKIQAAWRARKTG
jgi:hypothetical protein